MNSFLESVENQVTRYKNLAEKAIEQLDDNQFFWRPNDESNSVAVLVKHIAGNMLSRFTDFLTTDGEKPWRDRDGEFEVNHHDRTGLMEQWKKSWTVLFNTLRELKEEDLSKMISIKGEKRTALNAIVSALAHYCDHIGQIIYISKSLKNTSWKTLSIPKKKHDDYY